MNPVFLLAPGASAPSSHPWMEGWAKRLERLGTVHRFDYPYQIAGRKRPDRQDALIAAHRQALARVRLEQRPTVLIGKSMGSRIGCHVSLEDPVDALVCLGYPLKGSGKVAAVRSAVLEELRTPILFVQGTRDPLCPIDLLERARSSMVAPNQLVIVEGGNHSLDVTKSALKAKQETQTDANERILNAVAAFLQQHLRDHTAG